MGFLWFESNLYSFFPIGLGELIAKLAYNMLHLNFIVDTIKLVHGISWVYKPTKMTEP